MPNSKFNIPATSYIEALRRNHVDYFVTVPDWVQLALHTRIEEGVSGIRLVPCCNEDQAVSVSAGLRIAGKNPIVVVQNQGIYACVNSLRAVALDAAIPVVFLAGQFGREFANFGQSPSLSRRNTVRYMEPLLDAMSVRHWRIEEEVDLRHVDAAFAYALETKRPVALLVGAPTGWN
jgi:sulfopyruvate decarboxylase TPP-binding subunit